MQGKLLGGTEAPILLAGTNPVSFPDSHHVFGIRASPSPPNKGLGLERYQGPSRLGSDGLEAASFPPCGSLSCSSRHRRPLPVTARCSRNPGPRRMRSGEAATASVLYKYNV